MREKCSSVFERVAGSGSRYPRPPGKAYPIFLRCVANAMQLLRNSSIEQEKETRCPHQATNIYPFPWKKSTSTFLFSFFLPKKKRVLPWRGMMSSKFTLGKVLAVGECLVNTLLHVIRRNQNNAVKEVTYKKSIYIILWKEWRMRCKPDSNRSSTWKENSNLRSS